MLYIDYSCEGPAFMLGELILTIVLPTIFSKTTLYSITDFQLQKL